ncbi:glutathione gamma-glutamylcysteinyltransferase-like [Gigantopelta aegis]|uniref:glutathione gamma-glutamylcysteinyltransferase-like n=1 Tax=Gigantopelta aegis TaxID=1735272 RepID=UPI001B88ACEA|nr:glutathione gamma-glutamylcysteinyltransferase-like [Gigantopelta aegis]
MACKHDSNKARALSPTPQFYKRKLPDACISFCSALGKQLFAEALSSGHMECYFKLAAQFRTQDEPAYCGLTTLVVALNALDVDPGRVWKGPWRWYHEDMLHCCVPLDIIQKNGINIDEFVCIGTCNSLNVKAVRVHESKVTEDMFRDVVKQYSRRDDAFLALSYSRAVLGQTGDGHFSPLGGYHPGKDLLLILDLARFKYPPHWVSLSLIYKAMKAADKATGLPRGFMTLSRSLKHMLVLVRLCEHLSIRSRPNQMQSVTSFIKRWNAWLQAHLSSRAIVQSLDNTSQEDATAITRECCQEFVRFLLELDSGIRLMTLQPGIKCPREIAQQLDCFVGRLVRELETSAAFSEMAKVMQDLNLPDRQKLDETFPLLEEKPLCSVYDKLTSVHLATILLLAWPEVCGEDETPVCRTSCSYGNKRDDPPSGTLASELCALREQLLVVLNFREEFVCNSKACVMPKCLY